MSMMIPHRIKILPIVVLSIVALLVVSCTHRVENSFNGKMRYLSGFGTVQVLSGEKLPYIHSIGSYGCDFSAPYLLLSLAKQDSLLGIYNVTKQVFLGNYFAIGAGPDDFSSFVIVNQQKDSLLMVNDVYKKELKIIRLVETVEQMQMVCLERLSYEGIHEMLFYTDSLMWMKSIEDGEMTYTCSNPEYPAVSLYKERIGNLDLNHMLLLADAIKPDGSKLVSLTGVLNQIDILSLTSTDENISVTTAKAPITFSELQDDKYEHAVDYYLSIPRCNDLYIIALHVSQDTRKKSLHVIDWQGNGVAEYLLREDLVDFCVDWKRQIIYGITSGEEVYAYQIPLNV